MPDFQHGFKTLADQLGEAMVGKPLMEEEGLTLQKTTRGWMVYTAENGPAFIKGRVQSAPKPAPVPTPAPAPVPTGPFDPDNDIQWIGSPNHEPGRWGTTPAALVLHTMGGSLAGTDGWFNNPTSEVSAHFGIGLNGAVHQYVSSRDTAWANGILEDGNRWLNVMPGAWEPNYHTISIETEDLGNINRAVTAAQFTAVANIIRLMVAKYPSIRFLMGHSAISPQSRANCPGPRWVASGKFATLAATYGLRAVL
jgi:hypothetical protein